MDLGLAPFFAGVIFIEAGKLALAALIQGLIFYCFKARLAELI